MMSDATYEGWRRFRARGMFFAREQAGEVVVRRAHYRRYPTLMEGGECRGERMAVFDADEQYRYWLVDCWDATRPVVQFIGLNPSIATETVSDPTLVRCLDFAQRWGAGSLLMTNLYALRETDPRRMRAHCEPMGRFNREMVALGAAHVRTTGGAVVAAWGNGVTNFLPVAELVEALQAEGVELQCLGVTQRGAPRHPLYIPASTVRMPWMPVLTPHRGATRSTRHAGAE